MPRIVCSQFRSEQLQSPTFEAPHRHLGITALHCRASLRRC